MGGPSVEQEDIVKNIDLTENVYGLFWENGPHYYLYHDLINDSCIVLCCLGSYPLEVNGACMYSQ